MSQKNAKIVKEQVANMKKGLKHDYDLVTAKLDTKNMEHIFVTAGERFKTPGFAVCCKGDWMIGTWDIKTLLIKWKSVDKEVAQKFMHPTYAKMFQSKHDARQKKQAEKQKKQAEKAKKLAEKLAVKKKIQEKKKAIADEIALEKKIKMIIKKASKN